MKKIIALILVIGCMLSLASCSLFGDNNTEQPDDSHAIPEIQAKVDASAPKGADITVTFTTNLGVLNGSYKAVYNEDGTATVEYSYEKFNTIGADSNGELKSTVTGTATVNADGSVIGNLTNDGLTAVSFDLQLDEAKLSNVAINAGILKADVKAADTGSVLGVALNYDVQLTVATGTNGLTSMTVAYTTASGNVEIVTLYN